MSAREYSVEESNDECWTKKLPAHYSDGIPYCIFIHLKREKNVLPLFTLFADGTPVFNILSSRKLTVHCLFHKDLYFCHKSETFEFSHLSAYYISSGGWVSSVGTVTRYETQASGLKPRWGQDFAPPLPGGH
jgi:hypothetical protein